MAAGIGVLVVPQSLARLHHRKDLTYRPVTDAPESRVALSWPQADTTPDLVEEFIGIVRGRTVNSTRGRTPTPPQPKAKRGDAAKRKPAAGGKSGGKSGAKNPRGGSASPKGAKTAKRGKPPRRP